VFGVRLFAWLLPIATGVAMALAYPPFHWNGLGWVALVPLLFAVENCPPGKAFRSGYIAGLAFFGSTLWWTIYTTEGGAPLAAALLGMLSLVAALAVYFGAAAAWFAVVGSALDRGTTDMTSDSVMRNVAAAILGTAGWVTLEWIRGWFVFGGFGWNSLGVSQYRLVPLIQVASVTSVYGVSALVCLVNFGFYCTFRRFARQIIHKTPIRRLSLEFYLAMIAVGAAFLWGLRQIHHDPASPTLRLALVQGNIPQTLKYDPKEKPMVLERYRTLTERTMVMKPDMIIWPESATPEPLRYDADSFELVTNLAERAGAYLLTGTLDATPNSSPIEGFNAAMLVRPDGALSGIYHKIHLVPFGEYVPLRKIFPFIKRVTPIADSFERGTEYTVFEMEGRASSQSVNGLVRFGVVICFEDTVPALYRHFVMRGVDFMVNVTNDAWFKDSPAAEMHLANAVFRCAETRRPLVRCTNNGVTCLVDEFGYINPEKRLTPFTDGTLICELSLPPSTELTFYTRHGDWFVAVCGAIGLTACGVVAWRNRRFSIQSPA
jgi:apolipoprotein N-acyltransferase